MVLYMKKIAIKMILFYQNKISKKKNFKCRHIPSCSNYSILAYERFGFILGTLLTTKRILTCNPLFKPKYDPVPKKKK